MKYCSACGAENEDNAILCIECGELLPNGGSNGKKSKGKGKRVGGIVAGVIIALAVIAAAVAGVLLLSPKARIAAAVVKTGRAFVDQIEEQDNLENAIDNIKSFVRTKRFTLSLNADSSLGSIEADVNFGGSLKNISGSIAYGGGSSSGLNLDFSLKNKVVQFCLPDVSYQVYGFRLKDLKNKLPGKLVSQFTGDTGAADKLTNGVSGLSSDSAVSSIKTVKKLLKNMEVENLGKQNGYKVYRLTWDARKLKSGSGVSDNNIFVKVLSKIDPSCVCLLKKGCLAGVEFSVAGTAYSLRLEGKDNLWETINGEVILPGYTQKISGGVENIGDSLFIELAAEDKKHISGVYHDDTNKFTIEGLINLSGSISGTKKSAVISIDGIGKDFTLEMSKLDGGVDRLASKYINVTEMSAGEIASLAVKLASGNQNIMDAVSGLIEMITDLLP